jgi:phosphoglycolate phosphatase-like HAD superfamily hydrolase
MIGFMANAGGAWDNAKKIVETELRAKGTDLHNTSVVGDTVGDQKAAALCRLPFAWAAYGFGQCAGADLTLQNFDALSTQLASLR